MRKLPYQSSLAFNSSKVGRGIQWIRHGPTIPSRLSWNAYHSNIPKPRSGVRWKQGMRRFSEYGNVASRILELWMILVVTLCHMCTPFPFDPRHLPDFFASLPGEIHPQLCGEVPGVCGFGPPAASRRYWAAGGTGEAQLKWQLKKLGVCPKAVCHHMCPSQIDSTANSMHFWGLPHFCGPSTHPLVPASKGSRDCVQLQHLAGSRFAVGGITGLLICCVNAHLSGFSGRFILLFFGLIKSHLDFLVNSSMGEGSW